MTMNRATPSLRRAALAALLVPPLLGPILLGPTLLTAALLAPNLRAQSPSLMPAVALPDAPTIGPAAGGQRAPAAALGSGTTLVVFTDNRAGDDDIFGLRVDAAGAPIDAVPFAITKAPANQTAPQVAWNGQDWLCVYKSEYDPGSGYFATQVRAQRVSAQGVVLDATPLVLGADATGLNVAVASDGQGWAVLWSGFSGGNSDVRARRVTAAGAALDGSGVVVQASPFSLVFQLGASFAGGNYLFHWNNGQNRGRRFSSTLTALGTGPVTLPFGLDAVRGNGATFMASWVRQTPAFSNEVVVQRFAGDLTPLDAAPIPVSAASSPNPTDVHAAWTGGQWLVSWAQAAWDLRVARVTATSTVLDPGGVLLPDNNTGPFYGTQLAALPGDGALQLWNDARGLAADDVFACTLDAVGQAGPERRLSLGAEALRTPRVTAAPGFVLVTTLAETGTGTRVLAWRVDGLGRALDPMPIVVATANHTQLQCGGAAWNGNHFLVVWADAQIGQVRARRLAADGSWIDAAPIAVQAGYGPDVAAAGGDFLVTALRYPSFPQFVYSYGVRVRGSDGLVLDGTPRLLGTSYAAGARVVELGGRWLVATESHNGMLATAAAVSVHLVDLNGTVTAGNTMGLLTMVDRDAVDVASSGTSALLVAQSGNNRSSTDVYAQRVLPDGSLSGPLLQLTGPAPMGQSRASVAWNGREYVVTYETLQSNGWDFDLEPDVYAVRIAENGVPIDTQGFVLWNGEDHERRADGDGLGDGRAVFAASVFDDALGAMRVQLRVQRPNGVRQFGVGTPGCSGAHGIDVGSAPTAGNSAFSVVVDRGPQNGLGVLLLGLAGNVAGFDPGLGVLVHVDPAALALFGLVLDQDGRGGVVLPLPAAVQYYGFGSCAQIATWWPGPCTPSPSGFSSSPGLEVHIQAP